MSTEIDTGPAQDFHAVLPVLIAAAGAVALCIVIVATVLITRKLTRSR